MNNFWIDRPVLVTGATGFVGSYLANQLLDWGANVTVIVRDQRPDSLLDIDRCNVVHGDLYDRDLVERVLSEYEIDSVFHLAAQTVVSIANRSPYPTISNNILTTLNVLEAVRVNGHIRHVSIASSDKAYGELSERRRYVESDPVNGKHPYDCSKSSADLLAQTYLNTYKLPIGIARCGNIYGGGDMNWSRLIPNTIRRLVRGKQAVIWGNGTETRDFLYVKDAALAYILMSQSEAHGAYNFSTGEELRIIDVVKKICKMVSGKPAMYEVLGNATGEIQYQWLDSTKARANLGWMPGWSFESGLKETVQWYIDYLGEHDD